MDYVFDTLINIILKSRKELRINAVSQTISNLVPRIFYVGDGKTGSSCIKNGFIKTTIFWRFR